MKPLVIEVALNGGTPKSRNPNTPKTPGEIAADALACLQAGASIIHTHLESHRPTGELAAQAYLAGWAPVLAARPEAILYCTVAQGSDVETRFGHFRSLAGAGMRMGAHPAR